MMPQNEQIKIFRESIENFAWSRERISLIKKKCHEYDEEWRIIYPGYTKPLVMREWIPSAVILGLKMSEQEERIVISLAKEAGIAHVYKCYIDNENKLNAFEL